MDSFANKTTLNFVFTSAADDPATLAAVQAFSTDKARSPETVSERAVKKLITLL